MGGKRRSTEKPKDDLVAQISSLPIGAKIKRVDITFPNDDVPNFLKKRRLCKKEIEKIDFMVG